MHGVLPFILAMIVGIVLLEMLADKLRIAYPILLVIAGLLIGFVPGVPLVTIHPDLIFFIFLPPLLFEASWSVSFKEMRKWWRMIGSFAFLVVFFTALSVALATHWIIPGFTLALGFLLGGIVSPPDAVSTGAITKFVKIPRATSAILEGESLLNDASSLIVFRFALLAVVTGQFAWQPATLSFVWMVLGGVGIGLGMGWLFIQAHKKLPTDAASDTIFTLVEPYALYWVAEQFHSSGVLAVVSGGLLLSSQRMTFLNSKSRIQGFSFWESFVFILNGLVFVIIGLALPEIVRGMQQTGIPLSTGIGYGVLVTVVLIVSRIISSYIAMVATLLFRPLKAPRTHNRKRLWLLPLVMGWTGMRGVVSLAAALAIPVQLSDGIDFPYRNLILFITFIVILLTLVIQGLTLPGIISRSGLFREIEQAESHRTSRDQLRAGLRQHIYSFLKAKEESGLSNHAGFRQMMRHWEDKMSQNDQGAMSQQTKEIYLEMLESQRAYLLELNRTTDIDEELLRNQFYQIDLEEERVRMI
ncbi:MAG: Na+/H+ antiporter [Sphingobacteriales bacterium]|nr:MAG: Na+/H+ antiporter [Sphingobacteriales bacterium]